jgi:hypothetical protein
MSAAASPHPTRPLLERFCRGEATPKEAQAVVRHLLAGCPGCGGVLRDLLEFGEERQ